jgi:endonuclease YncB( thermonuclease family)
MKSSIFPIWETSNFDHSSFLYQYKCILAEEWYDADTPRVLIDLGFNNWQVGPIKGGNFRGIPIRLARINAWEVSGKEKERGILARDFCRSIIKPQDSFTIYTYKDETGKYGRLLVDVKVKYEGKDTCLNDLLVTLGHAIYQDY